MCGACAHAATVRLMSCICALCTDVAVCVRERTLRASHLERARTRTLHKLYVWIHVAVCGHISI